jgi:uncharacterized protein YjiS (DUF1127 family)
LIDFVPPASSQRDDFVSGIGAQANGKRKPRVLSIAYGHIRPLMLQAPALTRRGERERSGKHASAAAVFLDHGTTKEIEMKATIKQPQQGPDDAHNVFHPVWKASTSLSEMNHSPAVGRRLSGSTPIDALVIRALAGREALLRRVTEWQRRAVERRELHMMTDRDLRDIGVGRPEAEAEANKPFWQK